ncbi:MAG: glycerol acyltransferase [Gallionellales bacterium RIFOXYB12_FULL_54_9]|nr:MAG: glycerol acyltransferase [Gallionellales bacterium RIFOXYB12_FULL_54_9]
MAVAAYPVAMLRIIRVFIHIGYGLLLAVYYPRFGKTTRRRVLQRWSAGLLDILNVSLKIPAEDCFSALPPGLVVANHISWLDVVVLNAVIPMRFVAKSEVRRWPAIGWLSARAQTLYIARGNARDAARINRQLVELLQEGEYLAIFPEGTSTDGAQVGRFHASLLQSAIDSRTQVHPVAIRYQDELGAHSTAASYIDEMSFADSLWNVLCTRNLHVCLLVTPSINSAHNDRRTLTRAAHAQISLAVATMP